MSKKPQREIVVVKPNDDDIHLKKKALKKWESARSFLVNCRPFLGVIAMQLEIIPVVDYRCRTASTDGRRVFCDAEFILEQSDEDSLFILAHQVLHCALMHFTREKGDIEEPQMWNFAIDHEVNAMLQEDGLTVPKDAVLYHQHLDKNAEQVYKLLLEGKLKMRSELMDDHEMEGDCKADGECDNCSGDGDGSIEIKMDPDFNPRRSDAVWREWAVKMGNAALIMWERGDTSAALQRVLNPLHRFGPEVIQAHDRRDDAIKNFGLTSFCINNLVRPHQIAFHFGNHDQSTINQTRDMLRGNICPQFPDRMGQQWDLTTSIAPILIGEDEPEEMFNGLFDLFSIMTPTWVQLAWHEIENMSEMREGLFDALYDFPRCEEIG